MRIGLTYDLKSDYLAQGMSPEDAAEFDRDDTISALEEVIRGKGHEPMRIGTAKKLIEALGRGERWDLVFNIAEGVRGLSRESQVPAILDVYQIPYTFSDPLVLGVCLHKGLTKTVVRAAGVPTADFVLISEPKEIEAITLPLPLFVKPVAEGTSKGVTPTSWVKTKAELRPAIEGLLAKHQQPVLVETYLPGRELTIGVAGTGPSAEILGATELVYLQNAEHGLYSYENKHTWEDKVSYRFVRGTDDPEVKEAEGVALAAWRALGCRDAGRVDVRFDAQGRANFIEVNPLAGINPTISDLAIIIKEAGIPYEILIGRIIDDAARRAGLL